MLLCGLTVRPTVSYLRYMETFQPFYQVYIVVDDNSYAVPSTTVTILQIPNQECEEQGFKRTVLHSPLSSRDKALYYFSTIYTDYDYLWMIEEDVLIPRPATLVRIDSMYKVSDLLCSPLEQYERGKWHWSRIITPLPLLAHGMICAIRCSKRLLSYLRQYAIQFGTLFMDEAMFPTLAMHARLTIQVPPELHTVVYSRPWREHDIVWTHLYHPMKDMKLQEHCHKIYAS